MVPFLGVPVLWVCPDLLGPLEVPLFMEVDCVDDVPIFPADPGFDEDAAFT
jgi:hypothetical protein